MSCIFCQIIEEADPVKVPELGDDYAVIKGKFKYWNLVFHLRVCLSN